MGIMENFFLPSFFDFLIFQLWKYAAVFKSKEMLLYFE